MLACNMITANINAILTLCMITSLNFSDAVKGTVGSSDIKHAVRSTMNNGQIVDYCRPKFPFGQNLRLDANVCLSISLAVE